MNYSLNNKNETPINIGVIIVNYNSSSFLIKALRALERQLYKPYQVIVLDNASTQDLPDEINQMDLPLTIIKSPVNLGFAEGNNKAVEQLSPEVNWIALLNPDAYPYNDWLLEMVKAINNHPEYKFLASKLICEKEPHLLDGTGDIYHISGKAWRDNYREPLDQAPTAIKEIFSPCAAAALYRKDCFLEIGGFDSNYFCYYEDVDLAFRLWLIGHKGCYVPLAISEHTGSATTTKHSDFYTYHGHRNLVWTYFKNMPMSWLLISLPFHILLNIATVLLFIKRGQTRTILKSKFDAIKGLPRIFRQRRLIQKSKTISPKTLFKILHKGLPW